VCSFSWMVVVLPRRKLAIHPKIFPVRFSPKAAGTLKPGWGLVDDCGCWRGYSANEYHRFPRKGNKGEKDGVQHSNVGDEMRNF
jgi:hypothetical protein